MLYLFNSKSISSSEGLQLRPGPMEKLGAVLKPLPDEGAHAGTFAGSIVDLGDGRYRMYYTRMGERGLRIAVAESDDGLNWTRPVYTFNDRPGVGANEIRITGLPDYVSGYCQGQVFKLSDDEWRMYFWAHGPRVRYVIAESKDGIIWHVADFNNPVICHTMEFGDWGGSQGKAITSEDMRLLKERGIKSNNPKALRSNDATYIYRDPQTGEYEMYSVWLLPNPIGSARRIEIDNAPDVIRTIHRRTSKDGLVFSDPELIIVPDDADPLDTQFYYMSVHRQDGWRFGFLGHYPCAAQTMDVELCCSRDGIAWDRPLRQPWLSRGTGNDNDTFMAIAPDRLLDMGDKWLMLYEGTDRPHNWWASPNYTDDGSMSVCAARFSKYRFAGLAPSAGNMGRLLTKPFIPSGKTLYLDGNIRGRFFAELCDPFGKPLSGYDRNSFDPISGNSVKQRLSWKGHSLDEYNCDAVSLRLELSDGEVYAIYWS